VRVGACERRRARRSGRFGRYRSVNDDCRVSVSIEQLRRITRLAAAVGRFVPAWWHAGLVYFVWRYPIVSQMFECPDCRDFYEEPGEATFALSARCFECAWLLERLVVLPQSRTAVRNPRRRLAA